MKKQLRVLLTINSFFVFAMSMFAPLYAVYIQQINAEIYQAGWIWAFYLLSVAVLTFTISKFENRKKYADYFLILGFFCRMAGWVGYIYANSLVHLYVIQLLMALGESFGTPSFDLIYTSFLTKGKVASEWGSDISLNALITAIASFIGGIVVHTYGFTVLFCIMIAASFVSMVLAIKYRREFS
jgi:MFS family permease